MTETPEHNCIESRTVGQHQIVKIHGDCFVDDDHIRETGMKLRSVVAEAEGKYFLVNLGSIAVLSSMMIGQLVQLRNKCSEAQIEFQVCDLCPNVAESLRIMNLEELLNVYPTEAEALAAAK